jgi:hypothetical protein
VIVDGGTDDAFSTSFVLVAEGRSLSAARALLELWTASAERRPDDLVASYEVCTTVVVWAFAPEDWWNRERFLTLLLRQAAADLADLPDELVKAMRDACATLHRDRSIRAEPSSELRHWAERPFGPGFLPAPERWRE